MNKILKLLVVATMVALPLIGEAKIGLTSLEESPAYFSQEVADRIITAKLETMTIDYDCLQLEPCKVQLRRVKAALPNIKVRIYVNPMELFGTEDSLNQRPMQKYIAERVGREFPKFYLKDVNEQSIVWWDTPVMYMMNLSNMCPRYNGKTWTEFLIDTIYERVYLPNAELVDGIEFDNLCPYISFVNDVRHIQIDLDNEGRPEDYFILDQAWRAGVINMLIYARHKFPHGFLITGRAYHYQVAAYVDGLTFENVLGVGDAIQGGDFAKIERWIRLSNLGSYYTFNVNSSPESDLTAYAWALLGKGYISLDHSPAPHGVSTRFDLPDLGQPLEDTVYPYKVQFDSSRSLSALSGDYTVLGGNEIRLDPGQKMWIHLPAGKWMINFSYEIEEGKYCSSELRFLYTGMSEEVKAKLNYHRWFDGERYDVMDGPGDFSWEHRGAGHSIIKYIIIRNMNEGQPVFSRRYEKGLVVVNPSVNNVEIEAAIGKRKGRFTLKPGQGLIVK